MSCWRDALDRAPARAASPPPHACIPGTVQLPQNTKQFISTQPSYTLPLLCEIESMMATANWRTINVDLYDPESPANFSVSSLLPSVAPVSTSEVHQLSSQIRQLLRGGDTEGALRGALENTPYGGDTHAKVQFTLLRGRVHITREGPHPDIGYRTCTCKPFPRFSPQSKLQRCLPSCHGFTPQRMDQKHSTCL